jgi:hypothetical protein
MRSNAGENPPPQPSSSAIKDNPPDCVGRHGLCAHLEGLDLEPSLIGVAQEGIPANNERQIMHQQSWRQGCSHHMSSVGFEQSLGPVRVPAPYAPPLDSRLA